MNKKKLLLILKKLVLILYFTRAVGRRRDKFKNIHAHIHTFMYTCQTHLARRYVNPKKITFSKKKGKKKKSSQ